MSTLIRFTVLLPLGVLALSFFAIALAIETMRDAGWQRRSPVTARPE